MPPLDSAHARWLAVEARAHESVLRAWLRRRFSASLDVDDLVQDAYLRILRANPPAPVRSPKAFLFAIAKNLARDQARRRLTSPEVQATEDLSSRVVDESRQAADDSLGRERELDLLEEAIDALPARCQEIFRLRKLHGLSQGDIARRLGISEHTVSAQLTIGFNKCLSYVNQRASWRRAE